MLLGILEVEARAVFIASYVICLQHMVCKGILPLNMDVLFSSESLLSVDRRDSQQKCQQEELCIGASEESYDGRALAGW